MSWIFFFYFAIETKNANSNHAKWEKEINLYKYKISTETERDEILCWLNEKFCRNRYCILCRQQPLTVCDLSEVFNVTVVIIITRMHCVKDRMEFQAFDLIYGILCNKLYKKINALFECDIYTLGFLLRVRDHSHARVLIHHNDSKGI